MSLIDSNLYQEVLFEFSKDKEIVERQKKEKARFDIKSKINFIIDTQHLSLQ